MPVPYVKAARVKKGALLKPRVGVVLRTESKATGRGTGLKSLVRTGGGLFSSKGRQVRREAKLESMQRTFDERMREEPYAARARAALEERAGVDEVLRSSKMTDIDDSVQLGTTTTKLAYKKFRFADQLKWWTTNRMRSVVLTALTLGLPRLYLKARLAWTNWRLKRQSRIFKNWQGKLNSVTQRVQAAVRLDKAFLESKSGRQLEDKVVAGRQALEESLPEMRNDAMTRLEELANSDVATRTALEPNKQRFEIRNASGAVTGVEERRLTLRDLLTGYKLEGQTEVTGLDRKLSAAKEVDLVMGLDQGLNAVQDAIRKKQVRDIKPFIEDLHKL